MTKTLHTTPDEQTRQESLALWLKAENASYADIGRALGVSRNAAIDILRREYVKATRAEDFKALRVNGKPIPRKLLPKSRLPQASVVKEKRPRAEVTLAQ